MIKKVCKLIIAFIFIGITMSGCKLASSSENIKDNELKIGITVYKQEDKYITCLINSIEEFIVEKENKTNTKITVNVVDSKGNTTTQNNQIDKFIAQDYDIICVNIIDRTAASIIINKAKKADIPVVFFNREPVEEDMNLWEKVYYVGAKAKESGKIQGEIIVDKYIADKLQVDKNNDGVIQYVMLEGEPEHQDSLIRTEECVKQLINSGIEVEKLDNYSANWQNVQAYQKMVEWIKEFGDSIEVVFSNNDDMALGAIHAIESSSIIGEKRPLVVGIDGIPEALERIKEGAMTGTVFNNYDEQAKEIVNICYEVHFNEKIYNTRYFKSSYKIITNENISEYTP